MGWLLDNVIAFVLNFFSKNNGYWNIHFLIPDTCEYEYVRLHGKGGASQVALVVKNPPASAGDARAVGLLPGSGRYPGEGNSNPLQYSCL